jgi:predicted nucleic acid-binding Zn ribbon protein
VTKKHACPHCKCLIPEGATACSLCVHDVTSLPHQNQPNQLVTRFLMKWIVVLIIAYVVLKTLAIKIGILGG